jgi:hypothetical protein
VKIEKVAKALKGIEKANKIAKSIRKRKLRLSNVTGEGMLPRWTPSMYKKLEQGVKIAKKNLPIIKKALGEEAAYKLVRDNPVSNLISFKY